MRKLQIASRWIVALLFISIAPSTNAQLIEGKNFSRLSQPQSVDTGAKIEVIEFFSYGCPHCREAEPVVKGWLKTAPADVQFRRIPAIFRPSWEALARSYYALEALGQVERLNEKVFEAIHDKGLQLHNEAAMADFVAANGIDRKKWESAYKSFGVNAKVTRAKQSLPNYQIDSVPTFVVDGKYRTGSSQAGGHIGAFKVIDALIQRARAERGPGK